MVDRGRDGGGGGDCRTDGSGINYDISVIIAVRTFLLLWALSDDNENDDDNDDDTEVNDPAD